MRNAMSFLIAATAFLCGTTVYGADGAAIFRSDCVSCHGSKGQGTPGLAPALKGDAFVVSGKRADVEDTIQNGRQGDKKKYKDIPMAMPAWHLSADDLKAVVDYIRGDLQKQ